MPEDEVATLTSVAFDPPDLVFENEDFGEIKMEITEFVPYDRDSEAKSAYFLKRLKARLKELGTRPPKPSNIFVSREPFEFPSMRRREIESIARQIEEEHPLTKPRIVECPSKNPSARILGMP